MSAAVMVLEALNGAMVMAGIWHMASGRVRFGVATAAFHTFWIFFNIVVHGRQP